MARDKIIQLIGFMVEGSPVLYYNKLQYASDGSNVFFVSGDLLPPDYYYFNADDPQDQYMDVDIDLLFSSHPDVGMITNNGRVEQTSIGMYYTFENSGYFFHSDYVVFSDRESVVLVYPFGGSSSGSALSVQEVTDSVVSALESRFLTLGNYISTVHDSVISIPRAEQISTILSDTLSPFDTTELNNLHEDIVGLNTTLSGLSVDLTPVTTKLDALDSKVSPMVLSLEGLESQIQAMNVPFSFFDLDGNFGSYPNGTVCQVYPASDPYEVQKSYFFQNDTGQFLIMYILINSSGKSIVVPHNFIVIPSVGG